MALLCKNIFLIPGIVLIFQSRVFSQKIKVLPNANRTSSLGTFLIKNLQESNKKKGDLLAFGSWPLNLFFLVKNK